MADVYGLPPGEYKPRNDFEVARTDKGGWRGSQSFTILESSLSDGEFRSKFTRASTATDHNESLNSYWNRLFLDYITIKTSGPVQILTVHYGGYSDTSDPSGAVGADENPVYTLSSTSRDATIMSHPSVVALADNEDKGALTAIIRGSAVYDHGDLILKSNNGEEDMHYWPVADHQPTAGDATTFASLISRGRTTYPVATFFWTMTWESELPIKQTRIDNLNKVDVPEGEPKAATGTRDWRLVEASQEKKGELYRCRLVWEQSEEGGWDTDVFDY